ncbi:VOC family protein [Calothrix sp. NIES-2098]|uniref:VOC family protein n=1 Tax=Calothrix sp. NIES-2098 TaxID=1954171 RepID=UPI000B60221A|nr:glyoxalase/bleomycin resistance protein/dioxygenase [Calothrix sp. NIES-2098]
MCDRPPIDRQITFLYTQDLEASTRFYEDQLGFQLWLDQGTCRIYTVTGSGYLGLCQKSGESITKTNVEPSSIISGLTQLAQCDR